MSARARAMARRAMEPRAPATAERSQASVWRVLLVTSAVAAGAGIFLWLLSSDEPPKPTHGAASHGDGAAGTPTTIPTTTPPPAAVPSPP